MAGARKMKRNPKNSLTSSPTRPAVVFPAEVGKTSPDDSDDEVVASVLAPSVSGCYIDLENQGKLDEVLTLQGQREKLQQDLLVTNAKLDLFGDPRWLLEFCARARNNGDKCGLALQKLQLKLKERKEQQILKLANTEKAIERVSALMLTMALPALPEISSPMRLPAISVDENPIVLVRDYLIKKFANEGLSDENICKRLDSELANRDAPPLGMPERWVDEHGSKWKSTHGFNYYFAAYRDNETKNLIQKMISKAKDRIPKVDLP